MREGSDPFANFLNYLTKDRVFYGNFFSIFIALVLQNIITLSVNLADNIMLGGLLPPRWSCAASMRIGYSNVFLPAWSLITGTG